MALKLQGTGTFLGKLKINLQPLPVEQPERPPAPSSLQSTSIPRQHDRDLAVIMFPQIAAIYLRFAFKNSYSMSMSPAAATSLCRRVSFIYAAYRAAENARCGTDKLVPRVPANLIGQNRAGWIDP